MRVYDRTHAKGFTLVEIMIVVAIIALIAAIAIPNLLRARHNANETAAVGTVRTMISALESFRAAQTPPSYPDGLADLSAADPQYLDDVLGADPATKQGYEFNYTFTDEDQYELTATPTSAGVTGTRGFFSDQSGVIRVADDGDPDVGDPPLE